MPDDLHKRRKHIDSETPHSRLFIIGPKSLKEEDFKKAFDPFGTIEDMFSVRDRNTGEYKGVTYIKYAKTSEAAKALEALHGQMIGNQKRPIKVMIASKREEGNKEIDFEELSQRLFVVVPRNMSDDDLYNAFQKFGTIQYAHVIKDKNTQKSKGVAYVKFSKFSEAAAAYEQCDRSFRAVFAEPKNSQKETSAHPDGRGSIEEPQSRIANKRSYPNFGNEDSIPDNGYTKLFATANPMLTEDQIWHLFDIVPSMDFCDVQYDCDRAHIQVVYKNSEWAEYAKQKFHGFEYPPGHRLIVRSEFEENLSEVVPPPEDILKLAETLVQATSQLKRSGRTSDLSDILQPLLAGGLSGRSYSPERRGSRQRAFSPETRGSHHMNFSPERRGYHHRNFSSERRGLSFRSYSPERRGIPNEPNEFDLPNPKPILGDAEMRARCFVLCDPEPLPSSVLKDLFCRFGNLIDAYLVKGKRFGYAVYASEVSANNAIRGLHGFEYLGVKLKVEEAEDRKGAKKMKI